MGAVPQRGRRCADQVIAFTILRSSVQGQQIEVRHCGPGSFSFPAQMRFNGSALMQAGPHALAGWNPVKAATAARQQGRGVRRQACIRSGVFAWDACPGFVTGSFRIAAISVSTLSRCRSKRPL